MSSVEFGVAFTLKGVKPAGINFKTATPSREVIDGVFRIDVNNRVFSWIKKGNIVHTAQFGDLYDAQTDIGNKQQLHMLFTKGFSSTMNAQTVGESDSITSIARCVFLKTPIHVADSLKDKTFTKRSVVQKVGKKGAVKRVIALSKARNCVFVYKDEAVAALPAYCMAIHTKMEVKADGINGLDIGGTLKHMKFTFPNQVERDSWLGAIKECMGPVKDAFSGERWEYDPFQPMVDYASGPRSRIYPQAKDCGISRAGPSPD